MRFLSTCKEKALSAFLNLVVYPFSRISYSLVRKASVFERLHSQRDDVVRSEDSVDVIWTGLTDRILYVLSQKEENAPKACFVKNIETYDRYQHIFDGESVDHISVSAAVSLHESGKVHKILHHLEKDRDTGISYFRINNLRFLKNLQAMSAQYPRIDIGIHIRSGDFVNFENKHLGFVDEAILLERLKRFVVTSGLLDNTRSLLIVGDGCDLHAQFIEFAKSRNVNFNSTTIPNRLSDQFNSHETDGEDDVLKDFLMLSRCKTVVSTLGKFALTASLINQARFVRLFESRIMNELYSVYPISLEG